MGKDGTVELTAKNVKVSTANPKDMDYDKDGKLSQGETTAEGDVTINTKNLTVECLDYEVAEGAMKMKAQTAGSSVSVRAEKTSFLAADAEGKVNGSFSANAKAISVKSVDVNKDSLEDSALAEGSTMLLVSEKMYAGSKSDSIKSKKVQVVSQEIGAFADKTIEAQQGDKKAVVQLSDGKTQISGETTIHANTEVKGEVKALKATIDDIQAKSHFKSTNIEDGMAVGGGGGSLNTKLTKEDAA